MTVSVKVCHETLLFKRHQPNCSFVLTLETISVFVYCTRYLRGEERVSFYVKYQTYNYTRNT